MSDSNSNISLTVERMGEDEVIACTKSSDPEVSRISTTSGNPPTLPQIEHLMRRIMKEENQILMEEIDQRLATAEQRIVSRITAHLW
jgi:organic radical activating enzyme